VCGRERYVDPSADAVLRPRQLVPYKLTMRCASQLDWSRPVPKVCVVDDDAVHLVSFAQKAEVEKSPVLPASRGQCTDFVSPGLLCLLRARARLVVLGLPAGQLLFETPN